MMCGTTSLKNFWQTSISSILISLILLKVKATLSSYYIKDTKNKSNLIKITLLTLNKLFTERSLNNVKNVYLQNIKSFFKKWFIITSFSKRKKSCLSEPKALPRNLFCSLFGYLLTLSFLIAWYFNTCNTLSGTFSPATSLLILSRFIIFAVLKCLSESLKNCLHLTTWSYQVIRPSRSYHGRSFDTYSEA